MFLQVSVCPRGRGLPQCMLGTPLPSKPPCQGDSPHQGDPPGDPPLPGRPPSQGNPPARETPLPGRPPSRPTLKGEIEGDQVQAHTQGAD